MRTLIDRELEKYCIANSDIHHDLLYRLERETHLKTLAPQMMSGPIQGKLLEIMVAMIKPSHILEIGTFTGYTTLCMAKGMDAQAEIDTIEVNEELEPIIRKYFDLTGCKDRLHLHIGDVREVISQLPDNYDLVFIDAGKKHLSHHFDLIIDKVLPGGWIISDNVLWSGKVTDMKHDSDTASIHAYNQKLRQDPRVEILVLPLRDGISIAQKKE